MTKAQILVISLALALFLGLYLGFDKKPAHPKEPAPESASAQTSGSVQFESLLNQATAKADSNMLKAFSNLENQVKNASGKKEKLLALQQLSAFWYEAQQLPLAGCYAEQVAELEPSDTAWSIAGATFFNALLVLQEPDLRTFCAEHAQEAFEKAATINPGQPEHQVNQALVFAENPPADNPMKAVLLLRELEKKYPESPAVFNALGRLAIKTGQWQKAIERLEKAWQLDRNNFNTPCLLAKAYEGAGQMDKSAEFAKICNK